MAFSVSIKKPNDLVKTLANVKQEVNKHNGSLDGDSKGGSIFISGVHGKYVINDASIDIVVTENKSGYPDFLVKQAIKSTFKKCCV